MRGIRAVASIACLGAWAGCSFQTVAAADAPAESGSDADSSSMPACMTDPAYTANPGTGRRYRLHPRTIYDAAIDRCTGDGAHLAVVESMAENQYLAGLLSPNNDAWIGLDDLTAEGTFRWITGAAVGFTAFVAPEPNNSQGEDCANLRSDRSWNDTGCEDMKRPLCECDPAFSPPPTPACRTAGSGFIELSGRRVFPSASAATWAQAKAACEVMGAHLLVIGDATENAEVNPMLAGDHWIGYTDAATEGTFAWVNGAMSPFQRWIGGTVPQDDDQDCAMLRDDGDWENANCGDSHPYACECDPLPP